MIQFNLQIEGQKKIRITSPASWRELTLGQLIDMETKWDGNNIVDLFSIVTGVDIKDIKNSTTQGLEDTMLAICSFALNQPNWESLPRPEKIQIGEKFYDTPKSIERKMFGQKLMVSQMVIKEGKDLMLKLPKIIAIYMQPIIEGEFDDERLEAIEKQLLNSPAMDCYALGLFFFQKSVSLINIGELSLTESRLHTIPREKLLSALQRLKDYLDTVTST